MTFKKNVVSSLYHDFYIFPETHCLVDEKVEFENYTVYHNNRAPNGNGHTLLSIFKGIDGQIAMKIKCIRL